MRNVHTKILKNNSPFRHMVVAAYIIGVGDVLCVLADLYWLLGDMSIQIHPHHYVVLAGLLIAAVLIIGSFTWLYLGVNKYLSRHEHIHTKHERLTAEIQQLKDKLELLDYKVNVERANHISGVNHE